MGMFDNIEATSEAGLNEKELKELSGRKKASEGWVRNYIAVFKLREEFLAIDGNEPDMFTATVASNLLAETWTDNAHIRDTAGI